MDASYCLSAHCRNERDSTKNLMRNLRLWAIALIFSPMSPVEAGPVLPREQSLSYAPTSWPTVHGDGRNSDFVPFVTAKDVRIKWQALRGAVSIVSPVLGPQGQIYITTGQGQGASHLHAYNREGNLIWQSQPQKTLDDLDSLALVSAPLVDSEGIVYVGDSNQYWAFQPDGQVKWVVPLPEAESPFISSILTPSGLVGGVTITGKVVLLNPTNGTLAAPILPLPSGNPPLPRPVPPGLWSGGLVDSTRLAQFVAIVRGEGVQVANTPAVHPRTGRIFIPAAGPKVGDRLRGRLYGIDWVDGQLRIAFASEMGGGSGTSPTLSPDGATVYAVDQDRIIYAFDTETGKLRWQTQGVASVVSPSVDADGTIYAGNADSEQTLIALNPEDGSVKWAKNYDSLAATLLPVRNPLPPYFPTGQPIARYNYSTMSVAGNQIWVALNLGYEFVNPQTRVKSVQPVKVVLAKINPQDGSLISHTLLPESCECVIALDTTGNFYIHQTGWSSSIFFSRINPLLPPEWRIPSPPQFGIAALESVTLLDLIHEGITWVQDLNQNALKALAQDQRETALTAVQYGVGQLEATSSSLSQAIAQDEISPSVGKTARQHLLNAQNHLLQAAKVLEQPTLDQIPREQTTREQAIPKAIAQSQKNLQQAGQILRKVHSP